MYRQWNTILRVSIKYTLYFIEENLKSSPTRSLTYNEELSSAIHLNTKEFK